MISNKSFGSISYSLPDYASFLFLDYVCFASKSSFICVKKKSNQLYKERQCDNLIIRKLAYKTQ